MRFLILTQYYQPESGAPQIRLHYMAREMRRLGHEVEVVTAMPSYPEGRIHPGYRRRFYLREELDGVIVHRVWLYAATGMGLHRVLNYGSFAVTALFGLLRARRPDYLIVESPPLFDGATAWLASRIWRVPFIFNVADLWPDTIREMGLIAEGRLLRLLERLERWIYRRARFVNAMTEGIRDVLIGDKGVPAEKVLLFFNGVDTELFQPRGADQDLQRELGLQGKKIFVSAGTLGYLQALDVIVDAMKELSVDRPEAHFVFLGAGPEKSRLERRVAAERIANISFIDPKPLEYLARLYTITEAGVASLKRLPLFEGARPSRIFPIMASGKPVLYSGSGEAAHLITRAGAGLVVAPEDGKALAQRMRDILDDPEAADRLGQAGRRFVENELTWSRIVSTWLAQLA